MHRSETRWRLQLGVRLELFYWALLLGFTLLVWLWPTVRVGWDLVLFGVVYAILIPLYHRRWFPRLLGYKPLVATAIDEAMGIILIAMMLYLTGGAVSPFFFLTTFPILFATLLHLRFGPGVPFVIAGVQTGLLALLNLDPLMRGLLFQRPLAAVFNFGALFVVAAVTAAILGTLRRTHEEKLVAQDAARLLEREGEKLRHLDALKDEFIATATHELSTPISIAKGRLSMALDEGEARLLPKERHQLETVRAALNRLGELARDILVVSRLSSGTVRATTIPLQPDKLMRRILKTLPAHPAIAITHLTPKAKLPALELDEEKMREAFHKLLDNALKFSALALGGEKGNVTISYSTAPRSVSVHIEDSGPGIRAADRARIFDKFVQLNRGVYEQQGSGLGLYIVKQLVKLHGGTVTVGSNGSKGAVFTVTLPRKGER